MWLFYAKIVKAERRIKQMYLFFVPRRILFYAKIVKAERRIKQMYLFFVPRRILFYAKVVVFFAI